jgi:branched-chain amino acid transport system substrate-binding protein
VQPTPEGRFRTPALLCAALLVGGCARSGSTITIAVAGDLKEASGVAMRQAAQLAVSEINARGGLHGGRRVELRFEADSGDPDAAVRVARALRDDPSVVAVVGHVTSSVTGAAARVYGSGSDPIAVVSPTASSPSLTGITPYFFRTCPTDLSHGPALAHFAYEVLHARRVAVLYENDDYGRGVRQAFSREFSRLGGNVVAEDPFLATTPTLEPYLSRLERQGGVDVVLVAADPEGGLLVLKDLRQLRLRWPVIGGDGLAGIEADTALAEGTRVSLSYLADRPGALNGAFVAAYGRAYGGQRPDDTGAGTYDAVNLVARAIDQAGTDRRAVRDYLAQVGRSRPAYEGVTGTIAFDSLGDAPTKKVVMGVIHAGRFVIERSQ